MLLPIVLLDGTMFEELNEAQESPRSRIAQLTYENQNFKERLKVLTTESDKRLKEFEECRRELEMKEKHIRHLWRKTNCSHVQTVHIFFIYVLIIIYRRTKEESLGDRERIERRNNRVTGGASKTTSKI